MTDRTCLHCGADISDRRPQAVFCCSRCKDAHRRGLERQQQERSEAFWAAGGRVARPGMPGNRKTAPRGLQGPPGSRT
jgi:hypothetical protein